MCTRNLPEASSTTHLDHCEPYCSTCYYKGPCRRWLSSRPKEAYYTRPCACARQPAHANPAFDYGMSNQSRSICRPCSKLSPEAALAHRESREKEEMRHLARQRWRCVVCTRVLRQGGPRWWGCALCGNDCISQFHPIWAQSRTK
jgi:hypothetical protein